MRIASVKIGATRYSVEVWDHKEADEAGACGDCSLRLARIRVADGYHRFAQAETFIHEVVHAILADIGVAQPEEDEEKMVRRLSPRLAAFMADNPDAVRELLRMLK